MKPNYVIAISKSEAVKIIEAKWKTPFPFNSTSIFDSIMKNYVENSKKFYLVHHFRTKVSRAFIKKLMSAQPRPFINIVNLKGEDRLITSTVGIKGVHSIGKQRWAVIVWRLRYSNWLQVPEKVNFS